MLDEFLPIYLALAKATKTHAGFGQDAVDRMDISVVAGLLGVGADPWARAAAEFAEENRHTDGDPSP